MDTRSRVADAFVEGSLLTVRERDVLQWFAEGKTAWEIGKILGISKNTANNHMAHIREKLGAVSSAHAVVLAYRRGVLPL